MNMKNSVRTLLTFIGMSMVLLGLPLLADEQHVWHVTSPDHGETYAYGSEASRVWKTLGPDNHLALYATYNNEPFAEGSNRRYDYFTFNFPQVRLGRDGRMFYFRAPDGRRLPAAEKRSGFLGGEEIKLLSTSYLTVRKSHGYLTLTLVIGDRPFEPDPDFQIGIEQ